MNKEHRRTSRDLGNVVEDLGSFQTQSAEESAFKSVCQIDCPVLVVVVMVVVAVPVAPSVADLTV